MSNRWSRSLCFVLFFALASLSLHAQKRERSQDPPSDACRCSAGEADCLFGYAAGCNVSCADAVCLCEGAWCFFGFPRPSKCRCNGPQA